MSLATLVRALRAEARRTNERRTLCVHGTREACYERAREVLEATGVASNNVVIIGERDVLSATCVPPKRTTELLGTTTTLAVIDAHDTFRPNALGRVAGIVDGGGLLLLLTPSFAEWPDRHDGFDASLAVFPYDVEDVSGAFRARLIALLRAHPGIAILDADTGTIARDGLTHPAPRLRSGDTGGPSAERLGENRGDRGDRGDRDDQNGRDDQNDRSEREFPNAVYERCLTDDQARCVEAFERLSNPTTAVVAEADRGRGKSSAAGLAAGALAAGGAHVLVTAPSYRSCAELFARAEDVLSDLDSGIDRNEKSNPHRLDAGDGSIEFASPSDAVALLETPESSAFSVGRADIGRTGERDSWVPDVVFVDEAAGLPVALLRTLLGADRIAFTTTVHGYEGAGRGFSIRFREHLAASDHDLHTTRLDDPIRYAAGDPLEVWTVRALLLDARPPVAPLAERATPETVRYERLPRARLLADERLLRETFGLLVAAHYRTEPNDLARILCAPNLSVRALVYDGHVVSVCLLAEEGGLSPARRRACYEGARIRGHMLPDVLTSQLRDEEAGGPRGVRVVRIATHAAVRSRGLGSALLQEVRAECTGRDGNDRDEPFASESREAKGPIDWLGVGYGATPSLVRFWRANGFSIVHVSTTRNERSGEFSVLMLRPLTDEGKQLTERHARRFAARFPAVCSDALRDLDPDVAREALSSAGVGVDPDLTEHGWRVVAAAAFGPGLYDADPRPFRTLALAYFTDPDVASTDEAVPESGGLSAREERLLVVRVFQAHPVGAIARSLGYVSERQCLRALGDGYATLVERYGGEVARTERERYDSE